MTERPVDLSGLQNDILELVVTGATFQTVADLLCRRAEALAPGVVCTLVRVDDEGFIRPVAAPSLPAAYSTMIDGAPIGPEAGSCGTAAYTGEPVEVTDITTDYRWTAYKDLVLPLGLIACWSSPIINGQGRSLASFAFYYRERRGPSEVERQVVKMCVHLCTIALERAEASERMRRLAYGDQLTGLPNRFAFEERMEQPRNIDINYNLALLMVDIDHLKMVNDSMGHLVGDVLIKEVAQRIVSSLDTANVYRLGGDEFAVLLDHCTGHDDLTAAANQLIEAMQHRFDTHGYSIVPQVTVGGAYDGFDDMAPAHLQQNADLALYHAKETRRGGFVPFKPGLRTSIERRNDQIRTLESALSEDRVVAYFQPVVRLADARITGVEALARIIDADGQVVSAQEFHKALNDPKNAQELTCCMLKQVAKAAGQWLDHGIALDHIAINLSSADFQRADLAKRIIDTFTTAGVPLDCVQIEVTETVLMNRNVAQTVAQLRAKGLQIALDDFGTGFASLSHLRDLPVDFIKIDRSFIDSFHVDRPSRAIVEALIDVAHKLDLGLIAEGIETGEQAELLRDSGCRLGQGYYFARPADADTIGNLLHAVQPYQTGRTRATS